MRSMRAQAAFSFLDSKALPEPNRKSLSYMNSILKLKKKRKSTNGINTPLLKEEIQ